MPSKSAEQLDIEGLVAAVEDFIFQMKRKRHKLVQLFKVLSYLWFLVLPIGLAVVTGGIGWGILGLVPAFIMRAVTLGIFEQFWYVPRCSHEFQAFAFYKRIPITKTFIEELLCEKIPFDIDPGWGDNETELIVDSIRKVFSIDDPLDDAYEKLTWVLHEGATRKWKEEDAKRRAEKMAEMKRAQRSMQSVYPQKMSQTEFRTNDDYRCPACRYNLMNEVKSAPRSPSEDTEVLAILGVHKVRVTCPSCRTVMDITLPRSWNSRSESPNDDSEPQSSTQLTDRIEKDITLSGQEHMRVEPDIPVFSATNIDFISSVTSEDMEASINPAERLKHTFDNLRDAVEAATAVAKKRADELGMHIELPTFNRRSSIGGMASTVDSDLLEMKMSRLKIASSDLNLVLMKLPDAWMQPEIEERTRTSAREFIVNIKKNIDAASKMLKIITVFGGQQEVVVRIHLGLLKMHGTYLPQLQLAQTIFNHNTYGRILSALTEVYDVARSLKT